MEVFGEANESVWKSESIKKEPPRRTRNWAVKEKAVDRLTISITKAAPVF